MKLENKRSIAFLLAIVMIFTFTNFSTLSAFANDDEPSEPNKEDFSTSFSDANSQIEYTVEPINNELAENILSKEIEYSHTALETNNSSSMVNSNRSNSEIFPDGVYSLENLGNDNYWASVLNSSTDTDGYAVQTQNSSNPMDSFSRSCLFKISRVGSTNRYVIRSMLNNRLGWSLVGGALRIKELPTNDANVPASDTFIITASGAGYTFTPYGTNYVITAPDSTSSGTSNAKLHRNTAANAGNRGVWIPYLYTGAEKSGTILEFSPNNWTSYGAVINQEYTIKLKTWSTVIGANTPYLMLHPDSTERASEIRIDENTVKITPTKAGKLFLRSIIRYDGTTSSYIIYKSNYIAVADYNGAHAYIMNPHWSKYIDIEGPSANNGAVIQQWDFHGAVQSRWMFELTTGGYYYIKSLYSNKYIGVDSSNTSLIKQYSTQNNYTKWIIKEDGDNLYNFICKATESSNTFLSVPGNNNNGSDLRMSNYTLDESRWTIYRILPLSGYELPYDESLWSGSVSESCNCYAYAINNQIDKNGNLWYKQQPGEYALPNLIENENHTPSEALVYAMQQDYFYFDGGTSLYTITEVGKYDVCPSGTYKIALYIDSSEEYHFYRQDADGLWSHKPGTDPVRRTDEWYDLIYDPDLAQRGVYTQLVGYFAVVPWNRYYTGRSSESNEIINFSNLNTFSTIIKSSEFEKIKTGMTLEQVVQILGSYGQPHEYSTIGFKYVLDDGTTHVLKYKRNIDGILVLHDIE